MRTFMSRSYASGSIADLSTERSCASASCILCISSSFFRRSFWRCPPSSPSSILLRPARREPRTAFSCKRKGRHSKLECPFPHVNPPLLHVLCNRIHECPSFRSQNAALLLHLCNEACLLELLQAFPDYRSAGLCEVLAPHAEALLRAVGGREPAHSLASAHVELAQKRAAPQIPEVGLLRRA